MKNPTITAGQLATLIDVDPSWVRKLAARKVLPAPAEGRYPLVAAVQAYLRWLQDEGRRSNAQPGAVRVMEARAGEIELRNRKFEEAHVERDLVCETMGEILAVFEQELSKVPPELPRVVRGAVAKNIDDALARCRKDAAGFPPIDPPNVARPARPPRRVTTSKRKAKT